tara:strand:+ start:2383 stop:2631 length:249 start_codon:yes stop_codon:yes gene_type:complete
MEFLTMKDLTFPQRETLTDRYIRLVIDSMDHKDMYSFVYNTLLEDYTALSDSEIQDEIKYTFDEETLEDIIDNLDNELQEVN